jgi:anti-sigma B factor antagonist
VSQLQISNTPVLEYEAIPELDLADHLQAALEHGEMHVVVDLGDSEMVGSSTLATLLRAGTRLRGRGGRLAVVCSHPRLVKLLRLTLRSKSFSVFSSREDALRAAS